MTEGKAEMSADARTAKWRKAPGRGVRPPVCSLSPRISVAMVVRVPERAGSSWARRSTGSHLQPLPGLLPANYTTIPLHIAPYSHRAINRGDDRSYKQPYCEGFIGQQLISFHQIELAITMLFKSRTLPLSASQHPS